MLIFHIYTLLFFLQKIINNTLITTDYINLKSLAIISFMSAAYCTSIININFRYINCLIPILFSIFLYFENLIDISNIKNITIYFYNSVILNNVIWNENSIDIKRKDIFKKSLYLNTIHLIE